MLKDWTINVLLILYECIIVAYCLNNVLTFSILALGIYMRTSIMIIYLILTCLYISTIKSHWLRYCFMSDVFRLWNPTSMSCWRHYMHGDPRGTALTEEPASSPGTGSIYYCKETFDYLFLFLSSCVLFTFTFVTNCKHYFYPHTA